MAEPTPEVARLNQAIDGLQRAHADRLSRIAQRAPVPQFRTLASGEVQNHKGEIVYRPLVPKPEKV